MKQLLLLMAVVAAMAGCAADPAARLAAELDGIFQPLFPEDGPGAAVLVVRDGKPVYDRCFGLADLETKAPVTDSAMLKWQVNDLRHYFENDLRFLREFNTALEV